MIYGLYNSAAGMLTSEYRQGVIANNLANAETTGFKPDYAVIAERVPAAQAGVRHGPSAADLAGLSGGTWLGPTQTSFAPGTLEHTGQDTDVALDGSGFLTVEKDGKTYLTRDGRFIRDAQGFVKSATDGAQVLDAGGGPLRVNPLGGKLQIDSDGNVRQDGHMVGRLGLTDVQNDARLQKVAGSRFAFDPQQVQPATCQVEQGVVERSGVEPLKEMVNMIEASRTYQMNAHLVSLQDQSVGQLLTLMS